jgi:hypothetical protein
MENIASKLFAIVIVAYAKQATDTANCYFELSPSIEALASVAAKHLCSPCAGMLPFCLELN